MSVPSIFNLFGHSPIRPLQKHMSKVHACVLELQPFFEAAIQEDWERAQSLQLQIAELEGKADELKRELRLNLPKNLFMAIPRTDVLELLSKQDRLANLAKDISGTVIGRKMTIPDAAQSIYMKLLGRCIDASYQANKIIKELDKLFEAGFSGKEVVYVEEMIDVLHHIERETDDLQIKVRYCIYEIEKNWPPVDVIFLYKVIEMTGDLANLAQHVGDKLQIIMAR